MLRCVFAIILCGGLTFSSANAENRIRVGAILPLSGDLASFGDTVLKGIKQANSGSIELVVEDDACLPAKTLSAYKKLTEIDHVSYILGPVCGSSQQAIAPLVKSSGKLAMLVGSGAENLYRLSGDRIFSPQYSNEEEARFNAHFLHQLGAKRVALLFYDDVFCRNHEKAFRTAFPGTVAETLTFSSFDSSAIKPLVTRLQALKVDGLYVPDVSPFLLGFRREMAKVRLVNIPTVSIYSAQLKDVLEVEGKYANGIYYSYPAIGALDAVGFFPRQAATYLFDVVRKCGNDIECARTTLINNPAFDSSGVRTGAIETRVIREGKFVRLGAEQSNAADARTRG
jgi:ABC-type branched-subunit amino acid transport system substrate-binding protein